MVAGNIVRSLGFISFNTPRNVDYALQPALREIHRYEILSIYKDCSKREQEFQWNPP